MKSVLRDNIEREEFSRTKRLTSNLMLVSSIVVARAGLHTPGIDDDVCAAINRLTIDVKRFEVEAWFGGVSSATEEKKYEGTSLVYPRCTDSLQSKIEDNPYRTLVAELDSFTITGQEMAGRVLFQIEDQKSRITLITLYQDQSPRMGIQGVDGTESQLRNLLNTTRERWTELLFRKAG